MSAQYKPVAQWNWVDRWSHEAYYRASYLLARFWARTMWRRFKDRWNETYFYGRTKRIVVRVELQQKQPDGSWLLIP